MRALLAACLGLAGCAHGDTPYDPFAPTQAPKSTHLGHGRKRAAYPAGPPPVVPWVPATTKPATLPPAATENPRGEPADRPQTGPVVAPAAFRPPPAAPDPRSVTPPAAQLPPPTPVPTGPGASGQPPGDVATRLTLDQVINAVLITDPRLRSGFEAINQANANAITAALPPNPTLFTDIQLLPLLVPFTVTQQGGPPQFDLQVSQPIDWFLFGKRAANMAREALGVRAAEADYADLVRRRVLDAVTGYYDVVEAEGLIDLARQDVANLQRVEAATARAVDAGTKPRVDLDRVRLDLLAAQRTVRDAGTVLVAAKARLRAMIGRTDSDPAFDVAPGADVPAAADLPSPDEAFVVAVKNRPDIEARRRRLAQAGADTEAQWRAAFPPVTPLLGYTRQYQHKAIGFPDQSSWAAALTIGLPLYDRNQGNRAKAASVLSQARYDLAADLAALRAEVETAAQELRTTRANAAAVAGEQLKLARQVLDSVTAAYEVGTRPLLDVLDAERNFRDTYRTYISARAAYWRAAYRFGAALGQQLSP